MAAVTLGVQTGSTSNVSTYATGAFVPAAGDLLLALSGCPGTQDGGAYTSSDAGKTYTQVTNSDWGTNVNRLYAHAGDQLADADSQSGTMDVTGDAATGCNQVICRISGMTKTGLTAIRQFKIAENQAGATTPTITFDAACLTSNPTIMAVCANTDGAITEPTGWTQIGTVNAGTPNARITVWARNSGFTGATITAGSSTSAHAIIAIELAAPATITAAQASFALTGQATALRAARKLTAAVRSFAFTGNSATFRLGFSLAASAGSFTLTGQSAALRAARKLLVSQASLVLTGTDADLTYTALGSSPETARPTGGWFPPEYGRQQSDEERREERERLGIIPREQKKLDRAAKSIAKRVSDPVAIEAEIMRAKEFDKLMSDISARNNVVMEGLAALLLQSLMERILDELRDEDEVIAAMLLEM